MRARSAVFGKPTEQLYIIPSDGEAIVPENITDVTTGLEGRLVVSKNIASKVTGVHETIKVIPDGNRGAVVPDIKVELWGREFILGIKGIGARMPMFDETISKFEELTMSSDPIFTSEAWFGENPWGAMSRQGCLEDRDITELARYNGINGFYICPMVRATPLPQWLMDDAKALYWYRRLAREGSYFQQLRLMPSDIRLFYQSDATLGRKTRLVLKEFNIRDTEEIDSFIDNYICTGIAALTLIARTIRKNTDGGLKALDFSDVWLDKDSVIAPDGMIYFADIEGIEWIHIRDGKDAEFRMTRQFDRNYYEFMYGLDRLLRARNDLTDSVTTRDGLRQGLAARLEIALERDRFVELVRKNDSLYIGMNPENDIVQGAQIKIIDLK